MVKNIDKFQKKLRSVPMLVRAEVIKQLEKEAAKIVRLMRAMAPIESGELRASINWTWGDVPKGAITIGTLGSNSYDRIAIKIYAGGSPGTLRKQSRSSGSRKRDARRSGSFETDIARLQEFGTVNMRANPFFFVVWRAERRRANGNIRAAVRRGIKKANAT